MAEPRRNLNIPIYDIGSSSATADPDEDVIDVEVIPSRRDLGQRVKDVLGNVRGNGVRETFLNQPVDAVREAVGSEDPRIRARQQERSQRGQQGRDRAEAQAGLKRLKRESKTDMLAKLKLDTVRAGEQYMESLRKSGILDAGQPAATQRKRLEGMHQVYASMMVLQCVQPLQRGLSSENVVSVLGMGAAMWMLSPNFRTQVGSYAGQLGETIRDRIENRGAHKDEKAREKLDQLQAKGTPDKLAGRWRRRLETIERAERGGRLPFTAQSAAMTRVALAEAAYADMRRPGVDPAGVQNRYETVLTTLNEQVAADGIHPEETARAMRVIVGQRLDREPALGSVFQELSHGQFVKSAPREVYINGTTETATVWTGDFVEAQHGRVVSEGAFGLRTPMDLNEHRLRVTQALCAEMVGVKSAQELDDALSEFILAPSLAGHPKEFAQLSGADGARRMDKVRTMFTSMADDALSPEDQRFVYSEACLDAIGLVQQINPELSEAWSAQHGEQWRERIKKARHASEDPVAAAESVPFDRTRFTASTQGVVQDAWNDGGGEHSTEEIIDAEVVEDDLAPAAESAHDPIVGAPHSATGNGEKDEGAQSKRASSAIRRARVNQHYNEVKTGGITGIGRDDAAPLQDVDLELG